MEPLPRKPYPTDVSDEEWVFVAPYLALVRPDAGQRRHGLREVLNGLRWIVRAGAPWRLLPNDLPPRHAVYQQTRRCAFNRSSRWPASRRSEPVRGVVRGVTDRMPLRVDSRRGIPIW